jgi:hypothetical protein
MFLCNTKIVKINHCYYDRLFLIGYGVNFHKKGMSKSSWQLEYVSITPCAL